METQDKCVCVCVKGAFQGKTTKIYIHVNLPCCLRSIHTLVIEKILKKNRAPLHFGTFGISNCVYPFLREIINIILPILSLPLSQPYVLN